MPTSDLLESVWYGGHPLGVIMAPLGWGYAACMRIRRAAYGLGVFPVRELSVPVIVVGNLTVGGTGKTPLVIWLAEYLKRAGYRPGVVSRGYGGRGAKWPQQVRPDTSPDLVGDEAVVIARRTRCPVAVSPRRHVAARELVQHTDCDLVICDDGLQHHAMGRDIEVAVVDGDRRFGNGRCLPAGPLREPVGRLSSVDMVVANGRAQKQEYLMEYIYLPLRSVRDDSGSLDLSAWRGREVHAVAGVGNPARFYSHLRSREVHVIKHTFPDHHRYLASDLRFGDDLPVVMTEKDAVKCREYAGGDTWYLPIEAKMSAAFEYRLGTLLKNVADGQKAA